MITISSQEMSFIQNMAVILPNDLRNFFFSQIVSFSTSLSSQPVFNYRVHIGVEFCLKSLLNFFHFFSF